MKVEKLPFRVVTAGCNCEMGPFGLFMGLLPDGASLIGRDYGYGVIKRTEEIERDADGVVTVDGDGVRYKLRPQFFATP